MTTNEPVADAAPRLSDADMGKVMRLVRDADSVELKVTIPGGEHRATIQGLPMDPVEAQPRQVFFFDTPDLALIAASTSAGRRRPRPGSLEFYATQPALEPAADTDVAGAGRRTRAGLFVGQDAG